VTDNLRHLALIPRIAQEDVELVTEKEKAYNASWKKRGGVGAYMVMIRKVDRIEEIAKRYGYDIFRALLDESAGESLIDTVRDLRCYLDLIEAEVRTRCDEHGLSNALTPKLKESAVEAAESVKSMMGDTLGGALSTYVGHRGTGGSGYTADEDIEPKTVSSVEFMDAKTTDYCGKCGQSPQSGVHSGLGADAHDWEPRVSRGLTQPANRAR